MPQLQIHPRRAFGAGFGIIGGGGALMYMDGLGVQKNCGPTKLLELSWAFIFNYADVSHPYALLSECGLKDRPWRKLRRSYLEGPIAVHPLRL